MATLITQETSGGKRRSCTDRCHNARHPKCTCICGGRYHGAARDGSLGQKVEEFQDQIIKELERRSQGYFKFKEGTLYPALRRLEKAGLILGKWQMLPNGRQRRYYHITDKGRRMLVAKRSQWRDFLVAMNLIIQPAGI